MMKPLLYFILFVLSTNIFAQSDFKKGFILTNIGDTIFGLIDDNKGYNSNAERCNFKKEETSPKITYLPTQIKAYRFLGGKYYVAREISKGNVKEMVFLEYLIQGQINFYCFRNSSGVHYFIEKRGKLSELGNEKKEVEINDQKYVYTSQRYIDTLKAVLKGSPDITKQIDRIELNHKSLIKLARNYQKEVCSNEECIVYEKKIEKRMIGFGVLAGFNYATLSAGNEQSVELYYWENSSFNRSFNPSFGFYINTNFPSINQYMGLQYELSYHTKRTIKTSNRTQYIPDGLIYMNYINFNYSSISNMLLLKYESSKKRINPVVHAGFFLDYNLKSNIGRILETRYASGDTYYTEDDSFNSQTGYDTGLILGLGCNYKLKKDYLLSFELRYKLGLIYSMPTLDAKLRSNTIAFEIGIPLKFPHDKNASN